MPPSVSCACQFSPQESFFFNWYPGDTGSISVVVLGGDGLPWPLVDLSLRFVVAASDLPGAAILWDLGPADESTLVIDADAGLVLLNPGLVRSQALTPGRTYPARASLINSEGATITLRPGWLETYPGVPAV